MGRKNQGFGGLRFKQMPSRAQALLGMQRETRRNSERRDTTVGAPWANLAKS